MAANPPSQPAHGNSFVRCGADGVGPSALPLYLGSRPAFPPAAGDGDGRSHGKPVPGPWAGGVAPPLVPLATPGTWLALPPLHPAPAQADPTPAASPRRVVMVFVAPLLTSHINVARLGFPRLRLGRSSSGPRSGPSPFPTEFPVRTCPRPAPPSDGSLIPLRGSSLIRRELAEGRLRKARQPGGRHALPARSRSVAGPSLFRPTVAGGSLRAPMGSLGRSPAASRGGFGRPLGRPPRSGPLGRAARVGPPLRFGPGARVSLAPLAAPERGRRSTKRARFGLRLRPSGRAKPCPTLAPKPLPPESRASGREPPDSGEFRPSSPIIASFESPAVGALLWGSGLYGTRQTVHSPSRGV